MAALVRAMPAERRAGNPGQLPAPARVKLLVGMVSVSVGLQLINAALVKLASASPAPARSVVAGLLAIVLALSFLRFFIWNGIYRRYPISLAYPLSAAFFPAVVMVAWAMGEAIGVLQVAGATIVMAGVVRFITPEPGHADDPHLPMAD